MNTEMEREDREKQINVEMEWRTEGIAEQRLFPLKEHLFLPMDPDLLGGHSCVLLELLNETPGVGDRLGHRRHSRTTLERIEKWSIPKARADVLFCSLWEKNLDIDMLKKGQALVTAEVGKNLESEILQRQAEGDKWKIELLKGIVFKMMKALEVSKQESQELMREVGQKNMEMETIRRKAQDIEALRRKAQDLEHEVGKKMMDIEAVRRKADAETELRIASMEAMTRKANDDQQLRMQSLQKELAEKSEDCRVAKRAKVECGAEDFRSKSARDEGEACAKRQCENGSTNDNSNPIASNHVQRGVGATSGEEEADGCGGHASDRSDGDELQGGGAVKKDSHNSDSVEVLCDSPNLNPNTDKLPGKTSQQAKSPSCMNEREDVSKLVDKSLPLTLKMGMGSPKVPLISQSVHNEDVHMPSGLTTSSVPSSEQDFEEDDTVMLVPDPDFHDFGSLRSEADILPGQIWAFYDDQDAMPRFYACIKMVHTKPFKACVNWVDNCPASDEEIAWTGSTGLSIPCGDFKIGGSCVMNDINKFSHFVTSEVGRELQKIYPKKGQVWAVYRDPEQWLGLTTGPGFHGQGPTLQYEMVEICSEFCEKKGLRTVKLVKVSRFKTVFRRVVGMKAFRSFKREELVKFSHCVPHQRIEDLETDVHGISRGSLELDPAATPLHLIYLQ